MTRLRTHRSRAARLLLCRRPPRTSGGEFPINDDWDHFATVADLLHFGEIRRSDWPGMPRVAQVFWGELFAKLFGLSYGTLRVSTISMAFVWALAHYSGGGPSIERGGEASFLGLLYATNPLVFTLSYSFMNDVPGTSMMLLVQAHYAQGDEAGLHLLAGVTAGLAYLVRQTAALPAFVLAAFFIPALTKRPFGRLLAGHQLSKAVSLSSRHDGHNDRRMMSPEDYRHGPVATDESHRDGHQD